MVALYFGYDKGTIIRSTSEEMRMWLKAFVIITIILSLIGALRALFNHVHNIIKASSY